MAGGDLSRRTKRRRNDPAHRSGIITMAGAVGAHAAPGMESKASEFFRSDCGIGSAPGKWPGRTFFHAQHWLAGWNLPETERGKVFCRTSAAGVDRTDVLFVAQRAAVRTAGILGAGAGGTDPETKPALPHAPEEITSTFERGLGTIVRGASRDAAICLRTQ